MSLLRGHLKGQVVGSPCGASSRCGSEDVYEEPADRVRLDPLDAKTSCHLPQREFAAETDPAVLKVLLKVKPGLGEAYDWVECGSCAAGWRFRSSPRALGDEMWEDILMMSGSFETTYPRKISRLDYGKTLVNARISAESKACDDGTPAQLQRKRSTGWDTVQKTWIEFGSARFKHVKLKTGVKYRVFVPAYGLGTPVLATCGRPRRSSPRDRKQPVFGRYRAARVSVRLDPGGTRS